MLVCTVGGALLGIHMMNHQIKNSEFNVTLIDQTKGYVTVSYGDILTGIPHNFTTEEIAVSWRLSDRGKRNSYGKSCDNFNQMYQTSQKF
jgi:hypothetical protein